MLIDNPTILGALTTSNTPNDPTDVVNKNYTDQVSAAAITSAVATSESYADTVAAAAIATAQSYSDQVAAKLDPKASCLVATTANITLSGTQTIDGVDIPAGVRVLVKNQATANQNGIYISNSGAWTRATDFNSSTNVTPGAYTYIEEGTVNAGTSWIVITSGTITIGTTGINFTQWLGSNQAQVYDIAGSVIGKPDASAVVARFVAPRDFSLPSGLTGSLSKCSTAPTSSAVITLSKNGASFGTITFAASGTTGTLAAASSTSFAVGDVLTATAPSTQDATFADIEFTLVASLS